AGGPPVGPKAVALAAWPGLLRMHRHYLLIATAVGEGATGLVLLFLPGVVLALLLGESLAAPEALVLGRITGAALLALGVACWLARNDHGRPAQLGLLTGVLLYDLAAAALLAYAGLVLSMAGVALWPAVALHAALAVWCVVAVWDKPSGGGAGTGGLKG